MLFIRQNLLWVVVGVIGTLALLGWVFFESYNQTKPKPGIEAIQEGRKHIPQGSKTDYKFNPPTGGDHYESWITKGVYDEPRIDGNVVHSLEHGYIVINYDCEKPLSFFNIIPQALAQESSPTSSTSASVDHLGRMQMTSGSEGIAAKKLSDLPEAFRGASCNTLKSQFKSLYDEFGQHKLIIQPRERMDAPIILTAWGRMLKLNNIDKKQIKQFIDRFRDQGPEKTIEP